MAEEIHTGHSPDLDNAREHGVNLHKRQSRVTVKYNRKQLQKRLDVEKWIDEGLHKLYEGKVSIQAHPHRCSWCRVDAGSYRLINWKQTNKRTNGDGKMNNSAVSMNF